jgi:hypothetical protein
MQLYATFFNVDESTLSGANPGDNSYNRMRDYATPLALLPGGSKRRVMINGCC